MSEGNPFCFAFGKVRYPDRNAARQAMRKMRNCYCYRCRVCQDYHIATEQRLRDLRLHRH